MSKKISLSDFSAPADATLSVFGGLFDMSQNKSNDNDLIKIPPFFYLHVLDLNKNVVRVITGPRRYTRLDNEKVVLFPTAMILVSPRNYCVIENPVNKEDNDEISFDPSGQAKLRHGESEIRFEQPPFPLYPGEKLKGIKPLQVIPPLSSLRLRAKRDFIDRTPSNPSRTSDSSEGSSGKHRVAGDEWLLAGPRTYIPQVEVSVVEIVEATVLKIGQALRVKSRRDCLDWEGKERKAGEEWLVCTTGAYVPGVEEKVVGKVEPITVAQNKALVLQAKMNFVDREGVERKAGEEWLLKGTDGVITYLPEVGVEVLRTESLITLTKTQYCVLENPVEDGVVRYGEKILRGPLTFFLQPGEKVSLTNNVRILYPETALELRAKEDFMDSETFRGIKTVRRKPGDRWTIYGPRDFVQPLEAEVYLQSTAVISVRALDLYVFNKAYMVLFVLLWVVLAYLYFSRGSTDSHLQNEL
eukprot:TRINITY_DN9522_c0_g1_i2.p1 TRINITY_DN9522_c0_g1~~TRINITY_DN9522_c0_g1_i2.p1  ORF type:complete len:470 (-),score=93.95 TRINITY_DN9522_c0_g1_i2:61-1470(-)